VSLYNLIEQKQFNFPNKNLNYANVSNISYVAIKASNEYNGHIIEKWSDNTGSPGKMWFCPIDLHHDFIRHEYQNVYYYHFNLNNVQ